MVAVKRVLSRVEVEDGIWEAHIIESEMPSWALLAADLSRAKQQNRSVLTDVASCHENSTARPLEEAIPPIGLENAS